MAFQFWRNQKAKGRNRFLALQGAYHGDTLGTMSIGERGLFNDLFGELLFQAKLLPLPYSYWEKKDLEAEEDRLLAQTAQHLAQEGENYAALIVEPLIQGAAGMKLYSARYLKGLVELVRSQGILVIFDEVMTGFGRTGEWFAADKAGVAPDILCVSKGITGGTMPLAATLCDDLVYEAFLGDEPSLTLYHGHSYTANPLGCAAGLASLSIMEKESEANFRHLEGWHTEELRSLKNNPRIEHLRTLGCMAAMEIRPQKKARYTTRKELMHAFAEKGILLRPLGSSLYVLPPYCITRDELALVYQVIQEVLNA